MNEQYQVLARAFVRMLGVELGEAKLAEVARLNAADPSANGDGGVCHSHDFCDANETMLTAFREVLGREVDFDAEGDADMGLCEDAWNAAKRAAFDYNRI